MLQQQRLNSKGERYVIGPTGAPLTLSDLPPENTQRWVIRRKAEVVAAVHGGLLTLDEACERYPRLATVDRTLWPGWPAHDADPAVPLNGGKKIQTRRSRSLGARPFCFGAKGRFKPGGFCRVAKPLNPRLPTAG